MHPGRVSHADVISIAAIALTLALVPAAGAVVAALGPPQTIGLPSQWEDSAGGPSVRLVARQTDHLEIEFILPALDAQSLEIEGRRFDVLAIPGGGVGGSIGEPMLPTFSRLIQIPDQSGVSFEIIGVETIELAGYRPIPMQPAEGAEFVIDRAAYERSGFLGGERVRIGAPAIARDLRVVPITFSPVRYDPSRNLIEVASRIRIAVRFTGVDLRNAKPRQNRVIQPAFGRLYQELVVNYEGPREDQQVSLGTYVLICPDSPDVIEALEPLIEWRTRKGFEVYLATTTETGASDVEIKAWLQNAYDTWENPPEFIALVGDVSGPVSLPCWWYNGAETDHPYVQLEGDDLLADAHIGRISVDSSNRLQLYVNKIVGYESTPYMDEIDWYTRACLVGDPSYSGISCVQVMQWLKIRLLEVGYTEVDTVFTPPWVTQTINALNRGDTVFSYRGYAGVSGIGTGHIMSLQNGWKMPYTLTITCGTGGFASGTSYSEAWIRAGIPPDTPGGGIAAVATSGGTHTRYNNCVTYGAWRAIFWDDLFTFGESLTRAKYELYINYAEGDYGGCANFTHWNNLMGDPAGEIWTGVPRTLTVTHPATLPLGSNSVTVAVELHGEPVPGAYACLWKDREVHVGGYTGADGTIELPAAPWTAGMLQVTVTQHDRQPYQGQIWIYQAAHCIGYFGHSIDDDAEGTSSGNGDGAPNPTELLEIPVRARNYGTQPVTGITGTLTCDDPYVTILDDSESFGDLDPGMSAWGDDDFDIAIDGGAPNGHPIRLGLDLEADGDLWHACIDLTVVAAELVYEDLTLYDLGTEIDPGEAGEISVRLRNQGDATASAVSGVLRSASPWVTVTDSVGIFGGIAPDWTGENMLDRFALAVGEECYVGHIAPLTLLLEFSGGTRDTVEFAIGVGAVTTSDPTGPDGHGYYAFDDTDSAYLEAPTYGWVEIAPDHGGPGIDVGLSDFGAWTDDDSRTVDLPFPFTFYGETFTRATICSNGWIAMGSTHLSNRRNWNIPAVGAPPYLIAPMWDNLYQSGQDRVYHWYDEDAHRYIVQWSRLRNDAGGYVENFEAILYDPVHYPTASGDGEIVFQYEEFHNSDHVQHYCTVGIENADQTDGLLYSYFNRYNAGAMTIDSGRAIRFTTAATYERGTLTGTVTNLTGGNAPLDSAAVRVLQTGQIFTTEENGSYSGSVPVGLYTVVASHPSFAPDTTEGVWIEEDQTTVIDFTLVDIQSPAISGTTIQPNTGDTVGPYEIVTLIVDHSPIDAVGLLYEIDESGWVEVPMSDRDDGSYAAPIPGQPYETQIRYYVRAADAGGNSATDPPYAPLQTYEFWVLEPIFADPMESGAGEWIHYAIADTMIDQWHLSEQRNHTVAGSWSWKFGDPEDGNYADLADGALQTPPIAIANGAVLSFWHWMDAEISAAYPGYAYDGGLIEMEMPAGRWNQIIPVGGYPYLVREGTGPGPFPAETPIYSGTHDWTRVHFELDLVSEIVSFRFRFGSDGADNQEGWYIDDLEIVPAQPGQSGAQGETPLPQAVALYPSRPNPLAGRTAGTRICFDLPASTPVSLGIFDVGGRLIEQLAGCRLPAGRHTILWNARDPHGRRLDSGVYFYMLETPHARLTRRLLLVR
jgi:hypothetical protein